MRKGGQLQKKPFGISSAATLEMWKYEVVNYTTPEGLSGSTLREVRGQCVRMWKSANGATSVEFKMCVESCCC